MQPTLPGVSSRKQAVEQKNLFCPKSGGWPPNFHRFSRKLSPAAALLQNREKQVLRLRAARPEQGREKTRHFAQDDSIVRGGEKTHPIAAR